MHLNYKSTPNGRICQRYVSFDAFGVIENLKLWAPVPSDDCLAGIVRTQIVNATHAIPCWVIFVNGTSPFLRKLARDLSGPKGGRGSDGHRAGPYKLLQRNRPVREHCDNAERRTHGRFADVTEDFRSAHAESLAKIDDGSAVRTIPWTIGPGIVMVES